LGCWLMKQAENHCVTRRPTDPVAGWRGAGDLR
jgi:hypothetical protein